MKGKLGGGWIVRNDGTPTTGPRPIYVAAKCAKHGRQKAHSLREAVLCGIVRAVRTSRRQTQVQLAQLFDIPLRTVVRWDEAESAPDPGPYARLLQNYLDPRGAGGR